MVEAYSKDCCLQFRSYKSAISDLNTVDELRLMLIMILPEKGNRLRCFFVTGNPSGESAATSPSRSVLLHQFHDQDRWNMAHLLYSYSVEQ